MTEGERERLVIVEQNQKETHVQLARLTKNIENNTVITQSIQKTLDELTGAKKVLLWLTGVVVAAGSAIATYIGIHHK